jgi:hypothetical protein
MGRLGNYVDSVAATGSFRGGGVGAGAAGRSRTTHSDLQPVIEAVPPREAPRHICTPSTAPCRSRRRRPLAGISRPSAITTWIFRCSAASSI